MEIIGRVSKHMLQSSTIFSGPADLDMQTMILKYAEIVKRPCTYLEAVDAEVYATQSGKSLAVAVDSAGVLEVKPSMSYWNGVIDAPIDVPEIDPEDPDWWVLLSCNANYDPYADTRNHWVPAFYKGQLSSEDFFSLTVEKKIKVLAEYRKKRDELVELEGVVESLAVESDADDLDSISLEKARAKTMVVDCQMEISKSSRLTSKFGIFLHVLYQFPFYRGRVGMVENHTFPSSTFSILKKGAHVDAMMYNNAQ